MRIGEINSFKKQLYQTAAKYGISEVFVMVLLRF
jgi:hypothetical protein